MWPAVTLWFSYCIRSAYNLLMKGSGSGTFCIFSSADLDELLDI